MKTKIKKIFGIVLSLAMVFGMITITSTNKTSAQEDVYEIINASSKTITVTIEHVLNDGTALYTADTKDVPAYSTINNYKKAVNYDVTTVTVNGKTVENENHINLTDTSTVRVYYTAKQQTVNRPVSFYDYVVKPGAQETNDNKAKSINYIGNYRTPSGDTVSNTSNNFTVGNLSIYRSNGFVQFTNIQTYDSQKSGAQTSQGLYVNGWDTNWYNEISICPSTQGTPNILKGLSSDYKNVIFNMNEPGVFTDASVTRAGKTNIDNYQLQFKQVGDTYELANVLNENGDKTLSTDLTSTNSSNFYPLDAAASNTTDYGWNNSGTGHNYYFGMRYDVNFTVGDYQGPLTYEFTGDDDLWVLLDGHVILDLGGIHNAINKSVDVRAAMKTLGLSTDTTHRLTVLYMERGGNVSNCYMKFTLPNATFIDVSDRPDTSIIINKVSAVDQRALTGAEFTLTNDANATDVRTFVSGADGTFTIDNLVEGSYTLVETAAPTGFVRPTDVSYKIIVTNTEDGKNAVAKLYQSDGVTEIEDNKIVNESNLSNILDYNKSVKVTDWDKREYQITLDAASKSETSSTTTTSVEADIMLVLDRSGSMGYSSGTTYVELGKFKDVKDKLTTRDNYYCVLNEEYKPVKYNYGYHQSPGYWYISDNNQITKLDDNSEIIIYKSSNTNSTNSSFMEDLKVVANGFVDSIASQSPNSRIGVTSFASSQYGGSSTNASLQVVGTNSTTLKNAINSLNANGGTMPNLGLELAKTQFSNNPSDKPKYVVLFTDGEPTGNGNTWNTTTANNTKNLADELKKSGITVYTIGFNLGGSYSSTAKWLRDSIASPNCALTADSMDELTSVFNKITSDVTKGAAISGATITDVIDSKFTLTDTEISRLEGLGATVTTNANGEYVVTWTNQEIPYDKDGVQGSVKWTQVINIVAKDSFLGDNNVITNGAESGIKVDAMGEVKFPQPTVNVKVDLIINNVKDTRFKGEVVDPTDYTNQFEVISSYDKSHVDPDSLTFESTDLITEDKQVNVIASKSFSEATDESNANTTKDGVVYSNTTVVAKNDGSQGFDSEKDQEYGILDITFVAGELKITKTINQHYTDKEVIKANQSFVFKIERYNDQGCTDLAETFYEVISFDANDVDTKTKSATITNLSKGYYKVTEEGTWSTRYNQISAKDSYTIKGSNTDQILGIGEDKDSNGYFGQIGHDYEANITFENHKNDKGWLSDESIAINKLTK